MKTYKIPRYFYSELLNVGIELGVIKTWGKWITRITLTADEYDALLALAHFGNKDRTMNTWEIGRYSSATALWHVLNDNGRP
jgi:hypothetical protein